MSLFRATSTTTFDGPHQTQPLLQAGADPNNARAAMIMIHGRGASAESILGLANELDHQNSITFYAPQANGHTWYPYSFLAPTNQNQPGLNSGLQAVYNAVQQAVNDGFSKDQIFLLGFSQGACLASEFVARHPQKYAGLFALSGGLIGDTLPEDQYSGNLDQTPVFMGCSNVDAHIPEQRVHDSAKILSSLNADVTKKIYPGMGHTINQDEIDQINQIISKRLAIA